MSTITTTCTSAASDGVTTTVTTTEATPARPPAPTISAAAEEEVVWMPPKTVEELYSKTAGNKFAAINAPTSGAREEKELACGDAPFQLYSLATPNGVKVSIVLEELEELGLTTYDAHTINIGTGEQFGSGFVAVNPNSKIPACVDRSAGPGKEIHLFESGSIAVYLCDKFNVYLPTNAENAAKRAEIMNWVMWQMGCQGPYTGQFGHFFCYAPKDKEQTRDYGSSRYGMEVQRLCDVLEKRLADHPFLVDDEYSLADMMCYPWCAWLFTGYVHPDSKIAAADFLGLVEKFPNLKLWCDTIAARPAVVRGRQVTSWSSPHAKPWLHKEESKE